MQVHAHAKINLNLRILRKRTDGFHDIETLMVPISLHDQLDIEHADDGDLQFTCSRADLTGNDNLVVRAVRLLEKHVGKPLPVRIHLTKHVPSGAGLGGGSGDAAAALLAIRDLFDLQEVADGQLESIAAQLGSDIPFFIKGQAAVCRGRGEILDPSTFQAQLALVLFKHPLDIPTPWAYQKWAESKEHPDFLYAAQDQPWGEIVNDLERPVFAKYLILGETKRWLLKQPEVEAASMTGSGSALFAILKNADQAGALIERAQKHFGEALWGQATSVAGM